MGKILCFVFKQQKGTKATPSGCIRRERAQRCFILCNLQYTEHLLVRRGDMRRENGTTVVVCIWSMISRDITHDNLRLKSVLTSVEQNLWFDGRVLGFPSLSWAALHGKIPSFRKCTPKLLLSRVICESLLWAVRPLVEEHNWSLFLAPYPGNLVDQSSSDIISCI